MKPLLEAARAKRAAFVFVGHPLRRDDGLGPYLAQRFKCGSTNHRVFDAGDALEGVAEDIIGFKPEIILIFDAAEFGGEPGEIRIFKPAELKAGVSVSTHSIPLPVMAALLESETGAEAFLVCVQLQDKSFGEGLAPPVAKAAESLLALL
ncbi:MAG TPA: hydrogenase maturation protease [Elusimicrobiales bacterium]|nr:hydrogenase maturation protease [Elusimicrobiales bacterium]